MNLEHLHEDAQIEALERKQARLSAVCLTLLGIIGIAAFVSLGLNIEWAEMPLVAAASLVIAVWIITGGRRDRQIERLLKQWSERVYRH